MVAKSRRARPIRIPRLTVRGWMFLAAGGALFLNSLVIDRRDLLFVASVLVAVPLVAMAYLGLRALSVQMIRSFRPPIVTAGADTVVSLQVRNLSTRPVSGAYWRDTAAQGIKPPDGMLLPGLDGYEGGPGNGADAARLEYTLTPARRGVYEVGPVFLGLGDPFGLAFLERPIGEPHDLVVTPRVTALPGTGLSITSGEGSAHELLRHTNPNSDELAAREYRPGDPLRRVHWPATARHDEIMVRQEEQRSNPEARIVLDTSLGGRPGYTPSQGAGAVGRRDEAAFEVAIEITASVGVHLLDAGYLLEFVELGPSQLAPGHDRRRGGLHGDAPTSYRAPGGDRLLLEGLANLVPTAPGAVDTAGFVVPTTVLRGHVNRVPTFAVLCDIDDQDVADLAALQAHSDPAIAFVLDTMDARALERLSGSGWHCIPVSGPRGIPAAWEDAQRERGVLHDPL